MPFALREKLASERAGHDVWYEFWTQIGRFSYLAFIAIVIAVYRFYLTGDGEVADFDWDQR